MIAVPIPEEFIFWLKCSIPITLFIVLIIYVACSSMLDFEMILYISLNFLVVFILQINTIDSSSISNYWFYVIFCKCPLKFDKISNVCQNSIISEFM